MRLTKFCNDIRASQVVASVLPQHLSKLLEKPVLWRHERTGTRLFADKSTNDRSQSTLLGPLFASRVRSCRIVLEHIVLLATAEIGYVGDNESELPGKKLRRLWRGLGR